MSAGNGASSRSAGGLAVSAVERRLRAALAARASAVTAHDLQPALPPTAMGRRRPVPSAWRIPGWRRLLAAGAALAVAAGAVAISSDESGPRRTPEAPAATVPAPSDRPTTVPVPAPSPTLTPTAPGPEPTPSGSQVSAPKGTPPETASGEVPAPATPGAASRPAGSPGATSEPVGAPVPTPPGSFG
ncbi:hypothetical protein AB0J80_07195 [Actinoplanes sp. NPDC049548]|uniref:hypothetical protein n=1 Tax=Actinoplanes sp. NPDC049548 TaxID=3155152 RepID=UPI0034233501